MALKISRILHAGYLFEHKNTRIVFDPIFENPFSQNCYAYPAVEFDYKKIKDLKIDAIFISHYHDDHCSLESLNHLDRDIPIYLFCIYDELFSLIHKLGFKNIYSLKLDETVMVGSFNITTRPALDRDVDSIFHIQAGHLNILNVVDSWIDWDTLKILAKTKWDMILWPFQTMREIAVLSPETAELASRSLPPEWIEQIKTLNPQFIVPSSCQFIQEDWSWYRQFYFPITYKQFEKEINCALPKTKVLRLNPSVSVLLTQEGIELTKPLEWITPVGNQEVDYEFNPNIQIQCTKEIAQHFSALDLEKTQMVYAYCENSLLKKYPSLDTPEEEFFAKQWIWKLSLFDHNGGSKEFFYLVHNNEIQLTNPIGPADWETEVPLTKLYNVLEFGESLSSIYLRVKVTAQVDIMNDPLIRCLFNGERATYQKAQLNKLLRKLR